MLLMQKSMCINIINWTICTFSEAKLRETKTKYTMSDIKAPLPGEILQDEEKLSIEKK